MKRFVVFTLVSAAAILIPLVMFHFGFNTTDSESSVYGATLLNGGQTVSVASLKGKPALLSSWASWCTECQHELPSLEKLWESRKSDGLMVVAVNIDVDRSTPAIDTMVNTMKLSMPLWHDPDNNYSTFFSAPGVPTSVLLDANGHVLKTWIGRTDFQAQEVLSSIDSALAS